MINPWTLGTPGATMPDVSRGTSPTLVGRDTDLERLRRAVATIRSESRSVVLISGEAGIGKSRILLELTESIAAEPPAGRPVEVLAATCIEVGERLPFLPILDWLDELRASVPEVAAEAEEVRTEFGGPEVPDLAVDVEVERSGSSRVARFARLRNLLLRTAQERDVVAVIDDLHWADRSTLDVVTFLARRLSRSGVLLVAAYRSDELHRRHPLTAPLAELERHSTLDHLRLEPLEPIDVARQIAAIENAAADVAQVARIVELADGNPFHVEELLALERPGPLPSSLRDVLAARLAQVDDATIDVLREAAAVGRRVHGELLAAISRAEPDAVDHSLRVATDARMLVVDDDGRRVRFRHALLREAVYDELLPGDRIELHRRIATTLSERPELGDPTPSVAAADLARHWLGASAVTEAFAALLDAGRLAMRVSAWAEARWAFEQALALWDRLDDASDVAAAPRSAVLELTAQQAWYEGDTRRALELNRRAQLEPDVMSDPIRLGRTLVSEAWYHMDLGEGAAARAAAQRAIDIVPVEPPSLPRLLALGTLGVSAAGEGRFADGIELIEQAVAMANRLGDEVAVAGNEAFVASLYASQGRAEQAIATIERSRAVLASPSVSFESPKVIETFFANSTNAPWVWLELGQYATTIDVVGADLATARRYGMDAALSTWFASPLAIAQFMLGRWDEANVTIDEALGAASSLGPEAFLHAVRARILSARGDLDAARHSAERGVNDARVGWIDELVAGRLASTWVELLAGDPSTAAAAIRPAMDALAGSDAATLRAETAWLAAWTAADGEHRPGGHAGPGPFHDLVTFAESVVDTLRADDPSRGRDGIDPWLDLAVLELSRRGRDDEPGAWAAVASRLEAMENRPAAVIARHREAEADLRVGDRPAAEAAIRRALDGAESMGATLLASRAANLARAGRLRLDQTNQEDDADVVMDRAAEDPWGLSAREREVLAMLIDGRTNAQIGEALYISDKTASVHVTHILDKLGVSSRVEAALLAVRAGFPGSSATDS